MSKIIVIGAGVGGLTTACLLTHAGHDVTVLESHIYPGGCAGTFFHQKYRFDAGATLAGGFSKGGPHHKLAEVIDLEWPIEPVDPAWVVHLPGASVTQWADKDAWRDEREKHFPNADKFWRKTEMLSDVSWDISTRPFPWPPESVSDLWTLTKALRPQTLKSLPYLFSTLGDIAPKNVPNLIPFLNAQLMISAQTTTDYANALYGSAAIDLPRRGVNHIKGGIGGIAETMVSWLRDNGAEVLYRQRVEQIEMENGRGTAVITKKGDRFTGDFIIGNLTPWSLQTLLGQKTPAKISKETQRPDTWGAYMLYLGVDENAIDPALPDHHQVIIDPSKPLGEGNSVFVSMSEKGDTSRAPAGMRAVTLSTHTEIASWWALRNEVDKSAYLDRRDAYAEHMIAGASHALPNLANGIKLCKPASPITFEFYTRRERGMVGGFAQTSLFSARGPSTGIANILLVGDSIFPGQSTAGVTLGGFRVAAEALRRLPTLSPTAFHCFEKYMKKVP